MIDILCITFSNKVLPEKTSHPQGMSDVFDLMPKYSDLCINYLFAWTNFYIAQLTYYKIIGWMNDGLG